MSERTVKHNFSPGACLGAIPAFPSHGSMGEVAQEGMTLRAHFAGLAMANMAVSHSPRGYDYSKPDLAPQAAKAAVAYADALLAELAK